jgi:hypothetical protein
VADGRKVAVIVTTARSCRVSSRYSIFVAQSRLIGVIEAGAEHSLQRSDE